MNAPAMKTKSGRLTRYALACGYIERRDGFALYIPSPSAGVIVVDNGRGRTVYQGRDLKLARVLLDKAHALPLRDDVQTVTYHRAPTAYEIRFGEGATHYADFSPEECCWPGTRIAKQWLRADDGLRYYR
jgi:hypothetical protein